MYKGFLGYMFSNLINAVFSYNLKWSLSSHYFSFVHKRNGETKGKSPSLSYFSIVNICWKTRFWGNQIKKICCLVAINNTAGLDAESSFHISKSVLLDIWIVWPCTKPKSQSGLIGLVSVFSVSRGWFRVLWSQNHLRDWVVEQACSQGQVAQDWAVIHQKQGVGSLPRCSLENLHNSSCR